MATSSSVHAARRKFLTLKEKMDILQQIKLGKSPIDAVKMWGVSKSFVYKIMKSKVAIEKTLTPKYSKIVAIKPKFKSIDEAVYQW